MYTKSARLLRTVKTRRLFSTAQSWDHDVLICGGGVVGAALAADVLQRTKGVCNVGIIELSPPRTAIRTSADPPDVRVYALSPNSIQILQRIGAWKYIAERSQPYTNMQVWEQSGPGLLKFKADDMDVAELGRICEDQTIQSAIYQAIKDQGHTLTTYFGYAVDDLALPGNPKNPEGPGYVTIKPKDPNQQSKKLAARLVVGADGANSSIRRLSGISTWGWGYGQEAVVATIRLGDPPSQPATATSATATANNNDAPTVEATVAAARAATREASGAIPTTNTSAIPTAATITANEATTVVAQDATVRAAVADAGANSTATTVAAEATTVEVADAAAGGQSLGDEEPVPDSAPGAASTSEGQRAFPNNTAWQKYLPSGPLAVLPLWENYASIVWSTSIAEAKRLKSLPEDAFLAELNAALQSPPHTDKWSVHGPRDATHLPAFLTALFGASNQLFAPLSRLVGHSPLAVLQRAKQEVAAVADTLMSAAQLSDPLAYPPVVTAVRQPRVSFPLSFSQASKYSAPRCALIGDAAHSIHPQAGQGLNLGIMDAATLSDSIVAALQVGGDIGNATVLTQYERDRYVKNLGMMSLVDGINSMFKDGSTTAPAGAQSQYVQTHGADFVAGDHAGATQTGAEYGTAAEDRVRPERLDLLPKVKQLVRSAGMLGIHQLGPLKGRIAKFAMGVKSGGSNGDAGK